MKKLSLQLLVILICIFSTEKVYSQNKTILGIGFVNDFVYGDIEPAFGLNLTRSFTEKSSFEIGIYFRGEIESIYLPSNNQTYRVRILEKYLIIPITYKFSSRFINISAGPSFEIYYGWKQKKPIELEITSHTIDPKYHLGFLLKIGKGFRLAEKIIFEPEIRLKSRNRFYGIHFGFGLNLRLEI